jgi:hypothetical protein
VREADFVMVGSYVPEGVAVGEWVTTTAQGMTAFYDIDTPVTLAKLERGDTEYLSPALILAITFIYRLRVVQRYSGLNSSTVLLWQERSIVQLTQLCTIPKSVIKHGTSDTWARIAMTDSRLWSDSYLNQRVSGKKVILLSRGHSTLAILNGRLMLSALNTCHLLNIARFIMLSSSR